MTDHKKPWLKLHEELGVVVPEFDGLPLGAHIERHAIARPDAPAFRYFSRTLSYAELNAEANRLANALQANGIGAGDTVGFHMPNVPQYVVGIIAVSKLGARGSGVSPLLAPPELVHQIEDAGISVLMTLSDFAPAIAAMARTPEGLRHIISVGAGDFLGAPDITSVDRPGVQAHTYQTLVEGQSDDFSQVDIQSDNTFMIQYTGGTTGKPKGAEISHKTLLLNPIQVAAMDPPNQLYVEKYASAFPFFHVAGLSFIVGALTFGAQSLLLPNPRDIDHFVAQLKAVPPTRLGAVPALYDMLLAHPEFADVDFSGLQTAKSGAAPLTRTTYDALAAVIGAGKFADVFGMTETGPCYINHPIAHYKIGSVGIPMPGADVRIMDVETGTKEMPLGEVGEIVTSGPQLMTGYLGLPDESARALREIDGVRHMYSGDVGYMDEDGYIYLCDRAKDMLVVGGFKVFSVEIEDKLKALPDVAESAIVGAPDAKRPGNDIVHLFVQRSAVSTGSDAETEGRLRAWIRANMAPYKVPKHIHFLDEIPLTPVGKIDKKKMRATVTDA
ncbi:long-chain-fatty-acid--CoA ligase [Algimonas arctica]|uniref:Long-chain-fatty-acid--CoA ligase n=1 Tax=Algimonas arctica TaxID=1479486 RepID=A0A8J3CTT0_9PROT|nr:class I adenylate-forming enzyme family protein [Algimonas arctica]GHB00652.1 long-chain-fatty-acid--CoA ligase [Algimonas arctica]